MYSDLKSELKQHLDANENLLWTGQPKKGIVFTSYDVFLIPFSLLWCGGVVFALVSVLSSDYPVFFIVFIFAFVIVGLFMVFGRFILDLKRRENTLYGLTENRIIIKSGIFNKSIKSLDIKTISSIECNEKSDGSGTIFLGPRNPFMMMANMNWLPVGNAIPSLELIDDARKVYNQIIELKRR